MEAAVGALSLPAAAVTTDTAVVVYFDTAAVSAEDLRKTGLSMLNAINPPDKENSIEEMNEGLAKYAQFKQDFAAAGGRGVLMMMQIVPDQEQEPKPTLFVQAAPGADKAQIAQVFAAMSDDDDAEFELTQYAPGWMSFSGEDFQEAPQGNSEDEAVDALSSALSSQANFPIRAAFVMTPKLRTAMQEGINEARQQGGNPMAGFLATAEPLQAISMGVEFGNAPAMHAAMMFPGDAAASDFNDAYTGMLSLGKQMAVQQVNQMQGQMEDLPTAQEVRDIFDSLKMEQDGPNLRLTIGQDTVAKAGKLAPMAMMMMMMGGM